MIACLAAITACGGSGNRGGKPAGETPSKSGGDKSWTKKENVPGGGRLSAVGFSIGNKGYIGMGTDDGIKLI